MTLSFSAMLARLPPVVAAPTRTEIRRLIAADPGRKVVVLDDDPTGTQTVYDVPVLTTWNREALMREFDAPHACFYLLTNSRSLKPDEARALNLAIGRSLRAAARGRAFAVISRSDSTLRGHFPIETDALNEVLGPFDATIILPYFEAGGRITIDDIHYVLSGDELTPVAATPFARDATFGYTHSNLREWVEEKTGGGIKAAAVQSIGIAELRGADSGAPTALASRLRTLPAGSVCIVNACDPHDVERFAAGALLAEQQGARLLYRTAAQFVAARIGLEPKPLLTATDFAQGDAKHGGLIIVGSHVPQSTEQLRRLRETVEIVSVELPVERIALEQEDVGTLTRSLAAEIDASIALGRDVVLFTSRDLRVGRDARESLEIAGRISAALTGVATALKTAPRFLVAKGGITSSDIATRGFGLRRAVVRGQIVRGVPVWRLGSESRFPGMDYVVFPGNVGGPDALIEVHGKLSRTRP